MTRAELLALTDCVECLVLFANEGIAMEPVGKNSDPHDVLCRLMDVMQLEEWDWNDLPSALRARAEGAHDE